MSVGAATPGHRRASRRREGHVRHPRAVGHAHPRVLRRADAREQGSHSAVVHRERRHRHPRHGQRARRRAARARRRRGAQAARSADDRVGPDARRTESVVSSVDRDHDAGVGRHAVDSLKRRGVDFIKIQSGVPRDAYFAIADEAKKVGIPFEGHVPDAIRASEAIAAGQRTFEHLIGIFEASSPDEDKYIKDKYDGGTKRPGVFLATYDPAREARIIQQIAAAREWQCPTLFWERGQWLVDTVSVMKDPDLAFAAKSWIASWPATRASILKGLASDPLAVRAKFVAHELDIVRKLHAAKVPFLAGTDTPAGVDVLPGISLHLELERSSRPAYTS